MKLNVNKDLVIKVAGFTLSVAGVIVGGLQQKSQIDKAVQEAIVEKTSTTK